MIAIEPYWLQFKALLERFEDINIYLSVVIAVCFIFIFMHQKRDKPILKNISILLGFLPVLTHELGHALACSFTRGRVKDIHMVMTARKQQQTETQGFASTQPNGWFGAIITAFMGYVTPPIILLLGVWLIKKELSIVFVVILILMMFYYFIKTKQKYIAIFPFGLMIFALINMYMGDTTHLQLGINLFISCYFGLLLGEILQSIVITARVNFSLNGTEWDGSALRRLTGVPSTIWFLIWTIINLSVIGYVGYLLI